MGQIAPPRQCRRQSVFHTAKMVDGERAGLRLKIDGKWLTLSEAFLAAHPGGSVPLQYRDADATQIFRAFHEGSAKAFKQLEVIKKTNKDDCVDEHQIASGFDHSDEINMSKYRFTPEERMTISNNFENLRERVHHLGLMEENKIFYARKIFEIFALMATSFTLQFFGWYVISACFLAIAWQQTGWLAHEFGHHQPTKNRELNTALSFIFGNFIQGFSAHWWKEKHNTHHAATNIIEKDCDIDFAPIVAVVPSDLLKFQKPLGALFLKVVAYQHLYFVLTFPLLRFSWLLQSILFVVDASTSKYHRYRNFATAERFSLALHWAWVLVQLWLLPSFSIRLAYFMISQLGAGFLIAHVVSYNHNSVDKLPENTPFINDFACLQLLSTRNMQSSIVVDWLWGGLNFQIEHHMFPTMPRSNLSRASALVKQFCDENRLPYMVDDYLTGFNQNVEQLRKVAMLSEDLQQRQ